MKRKGVTSIEHDDCISYISKLFNLTPVNVSTKGYRAGDNGRYFPDAINSTTDYEIEVVPRKSYLLDKSTRWDNTRKKVLVLRINTFAENSFNEIYIYSSNNKLIKVK